MPAKKSVRRSFQMRSPCAKVLDTSLPITTSTPHTSSSSIVSKGGMVTRSNAFRHKKTQPDTLSLRSTCAYKHDSLDSVKSSGTDFDYDDDNISLLDGTSCSEIGDYVPKRISFGSGALEKRKTVKSIASFHMNLSAVI